MKILITGGGGFLGSQLAQKLLAHGTLVGPSGNPEALREIVLLDAVFARPAPVHATIRVTPVLGDISDHATVFSAAGLASLVAPVASIFHLASMVSGECEERFDDALRVNLDGGRHVFEAARAVSAATGTRARVVFASSIACYSSEAVAPVNSDTTKLTPRTTYGMTKAICELLLNDHSRKGHFDGRTARLPTVMHPAKRLQIDIVKRLNPERDSIHTAGGIGHKPLSFCSAGVRFKRNFCIGPQV
jgi:nucleoside-diphosphate-sugar epimerase